MPPSEQEDIIVIGDCAIHQAFSIQPRALSLSLGELINYWNM